MSGGDKGFEAPQSQSKSSPLKKEGLPGKDREGKNNKRFQVGTVLRRVGRYLTGFQEITKDDKTQPVDPGEALKMLAELGKDPQQNPGQNDPNSDQAHKAYIDREIERLREEQPGQRNPENPQITSPIDGPVIDTKAHAEERAREQMVPEEVITTLNENAEPYVLGMDVRSREILAGTLTPREGLHVGYKEGEKGKIPFGGSWVSTTQRGGREIKYDSSISFHDEFEPEVAIRNRDAITDRFNTRISSEGLFSQGNASFKKTNEALTFHLEWDNAPSDLMPSLLKESYLQQRLLGIEEKLKSCTHLKAKVDLSIPANSDGSNQPEIRITYSGFNKSGREVVESEVLIPNGFTNNDAASIPLENFSNSMEVLFQVLPLGELITSEHGFKAYPLLDADLPKAA